MRTSRALRETLHHLRNSLADLGGIGFRSADDGRPSSAEDQFFRPRIDKVDNHRPFPILINARVSLGRTRPHSVIAVAIWPEAVTTITPVRILLHGSPFLDEDMPDNVEVGLFALHFVDATSGQFRAER